MTEVQRLLSYDRPGSKLTGHVLASAEVRRLLSNDRLDLE